MITFCWAASFFTSSFFGVRIAGKNLAGMCGTRQTIHNGEMVLFSVGVTCLFTMWKMGL